MPNRRRLLISLSASFLLVLAQLLVLNHVHAQDEPPSLCAYCISSANVDGIVAKTQSSIHFSVANVVPSTVLVAWFIAVRRHYASRAPPKVSN